MLIADLLKEKIQLAVRQAYGDVLDADLIDIHLEHPENEAYGDYATNVAMRLTKALKQSPLAIAKKISYEILSLNPSVTMGDINIPIISKIDAVSPGFINIKLTDLWLQNVLFSIYNAGSDYGSSNMGSNKRVALEHSNVNPNKAAHIGHLRNACLGQFIERVYEFLGYNVEVQYYANDVGVQVATSSMGINYVKDVDPKQYTKFDHYAWDIYSKMESIILGSSELEKSREKLMIQLDDPNSEASKTQRTLANKILEAQLTTFKNLDIDYDVIIHESDILALKLWEKAFLQLKCNENVYFATSGVSKGCWLIKVSDKTVTAEGVQIAKELGVEEDKILVRSNGVPTYTAKDIAYHMWKFGLLDTDFFYKKVNYDTQAKILYETVSKADLSDVTGTSFTNADIVYDVIGGEQTYAMDVVKKSLGYLGFADSAANMTHVNYGFVYLSPATAGALGIDTTDGKDRYGMSGRRGWGIKIDDFIDMVDAKLLADHGVSGALTAVRNGAIKFEVLKYNTYVDMVFDLQSALNLKGFSGPYIQYTYARANSVINKSDFIYDESLIFNDVSVYGLKGLAAEELILLRNLYKFPEIVLASARDFSPSSICTYLFEVAKLFNNFYANHPIKNAEDVVDRHFRLLLTACVGIVLKNGMRLLGIDAVDKM